MKKKQKPKPRICIDYEGMGTCVDATIYLGEKCVCVMYSVDPKMNELTIRAAKAIIRSFERMK